VAAAAAALAGIATVVVVVVVVEQEYRRADVAAVVVPEVGLTSDQPQGLAREGALSEGGAHNIYKLVYMVYDIMFVFVVLSLLMRSGRWGSTNIITLGEARSYEARGGIAVLLPRRLYVDDISA
jgi:hypothetical protein